MYTSSVTIRVRYAETDQMGYVYYGHYAQYFEVARVEALRQLELHYKSMEEQGIALPVISYNIRFFKPAYYDDLLCIKTSIKDLPGVRIHFYYETFNSDNELLNQAETTLVFMNRQKDKPCHPPQNFIDKISRFFEPTGTV